MLLAGDVGGTKADVALFSRELGPRQPVTSARLPVADYDSLEDLVLDFLRGAGAPELAGACFGVAGPVVDGRAVGTNLRWTVEESVLARRLQIERVKLLNDLEAIACGVPLLQGADLCTLCEGQPVAQGTLAIIAPGTGLGEAFLIWDGQRYRAMPSEGGHTDFSPNSVLECELWRYLQPRFGHVSCERVCSGVGIPNIYAFLRDTGRASEPPWLAAQLATADDPTPTIVTAALRSDPEYALCRQTLEMFVAILGAAAGNLALRVLATGGVFVGGGIPPRILSALASPSFTDAFAAKGRLQPVMERIPVHVILNAQTGLLGAAAYALDHAWDAPAAS